MTQKEIAGTLGISQSTVSLALAGSEKIGAHIRAQVQALAKESGYSRNLNAIALQGRKSKLVGIIFPDFSEDYYNELKKDIHALLKDRGYTGLFFTTGYDGDIDGILDELQGRGVEGVITGPRTTPRLKKLCLDGLPAVFYRKPPAIPCSSVDVDRYEGGYMAGRHLLSLGRGSFVILGGADPSDPGARFKGFLAALAEAGVEMPESAMLPCRTGMAHGYESLRGYLKKNAGRRPDAVFAFNDATAIGGMRAASEAGLRIPEDIAFIGFDDIEAARFSIPALTTVAQPRAETARRLVELLFDAIDGKDRSMRHITLRCELKIRESCGAKLGNRRD